MVSLLLVWIDFALTCLFSHSCFNNNTFLTASIFLLVREKNHNVAPAESKAEEIICFSHNFKVINKISFAVRFRKNTLFVSLRSKLSLTTLKGWVTQCLLHVHGSQVQIKTGSNKFCPVIKHYSNKTLRLYLKNSHYTRHIHFQPHICQ